MKLLKLNHHNNINFLDLEFLGGSFTFIEKIKLRGTGSPKLIYRSGIEAIDKSLTTHSNKINYVNFELFKNGIVIRYKNDTKSIGIGIQINEIERIVLTAFKIKIWRKIRWKKQSDIVYRGELDIFINNKVLQFSILTKDFESCFNFWNKKHLHEKFEYKVSNTPPENDESLLFNFF